MSLLEAPVGPHVPRRDVLARALRLVAGTLALAGWSATLAGAQTGTQSPPRLAASPAAASRHPRHLHRPGMRLDSVTALTRAIADLKAQARRKTVEPEEDREPQEKVKQRTALGPATRDEEEEDGTDYLQAYLYFLRQRAYPGDTIDWSYYPRARTHRDQMPPAHIGPPAIHSARFIGPTWQFIGPRNLDSPFLIYDGPGPLSGRVNAAAFDPQNPATYYLASAGGGVWKTTDSGAHWTPLTDAWPALQVSSLAIDPKNSQILYVGTGDFDGSQGSGFGMMKSTDGGATWQSIGAPNFDGLAVASIVIDPDDSSLLTATTGRGSNYWGSIWHSVDGGATWQAATSTRAAWSDLKIGAPDSQGHRYYYATGLYNGGFVYRSSDKGATWQALSPPLGGVYSSDEDSLRLATSPTDPNTVYLVSGYDSTIWESADAGVTWTDITNDFPNGDGYYNWSQTWYDCTMLCSTFKDSAGQSHDVLYVGLIDLAQTIIDPTQPPGSNSWRSVGGPTYTNAALTHNDHHALAVDPADPDSLLVGNDGGIFHFTYDPKADTWGFQSLNQNLALTQFYALAPHPGDPTRILGGAQDNGVPHADGDLQNWRNIISGDGGFCAINPSNTAIQYVTSDGLNIYHTVNDWKTEGYTSPPLNFNSGITDYVAFIPPIVLDQNNPDQLYAASNFLYRWNQTGGYWSGRLGSQRLSSNYYVQAVALAPGDSSRIYTGSVDGELWMTANGGLSWQRIDGGSSSLPGFAITSISVNPNNANDVLVGLSAYSSDRIYHCANTLSATRAWTNISGSGATGLPAIPLNAIARDIDDPAHTFFVGMDVGVFTTSDAGAHWANATQPLGLPNAMVNDLKVVPGTRSLIAATYGRGMWRLDLPSALALSVLSVNPIAVRGGIGSQGTVQLNALAPTGGATVTLSSSDPQSASVPASVLVGAGTAAVTFPIQTKRVIRLTPVTLTATYQNVTMQATLTLLPNGAAGGPKPIRPLPTPGGHSGGKSR